MRKPLAMMTGIALALASLMGSAAAQQAGWGESDQALASYRRSLELDPANANAARMLRRLEEKKSGDR